MAKVKGTTVKGPTRMERFLVIRKAILDSRHMMYRCGPGEYRLDCGSFTIGLSDPGVFGPSRGFVLDIWPGAKPCSSGHWPIAINHKVASAEWDHGRPLRLISYRSGPWESELIDLLQTGFKASGSEFRTPAPIAELLSRILKLSGGHVLRNERTLASVDKHGS